MSTHISQQQGNDGNTSKVRGRNLWIKILIPLLISVVCLYIATRNVDWDEFRRIIAGAKFAPIIIGLSISLISLWLRAVRWQIMLNPFQNISLLPLFRWQIGGLMISNLLPLRMGEFARAYWAGHKSAVSKSTIFATIVVERVLDVGFIAMIAVILLIIMGVGQTGDLLTLGNGVGFILAGGLAVWAIWLFLTRVDHKRLFSKIVRFMPEKIMPIAENFVIGFSVLKDKREIAKLFLLSPVIWSIDIYAISVMSRSLDLNLSWMECGLTMTGLILGVMIPAAPGSGGTYEAGGTAALVLLGYDNTVAFSYVLMIHVLQFLFVLMLGIPILMIEGFNPKKTL